MFFFFRFCSKKKFLLGGGGGDRSLPAFCESGNKKKILLGKIL